MTEENMKKYVNLSCNDFIDVVAGKDPIPGGGSVSGLVGALGAALGNMVASLTVGKKKYADVEEEMEDYILDIRRVQENLKELVQADIEDFEPLSRLYKVKPKTDEEKRRHERQLEGALYDACQVPMEIMRQCGKAIELAGEFARKGNRIAISDAAASAVICKAAMEAASLNVYINTNMMKDKETADRLNGRCAQYIVYYGAAADSVFGYTTNKLMTTAI